MPVVLALISGLSWGVSDFLGGMLSKKHGAWVTAIAVQVGAVVSTAVAAAALGGSPTSSDWFWGSASGVGVGIGTAFLFRGLSTGRMGVVAPVSAVGTALVPVAYGLATGERPGLLTVVGIVAAFPAIWLIAASTDGSEPTSTSSGVTDAVIAGLGFGAGFVCLDRVAPAAGLAPLVAEQIVSLAPVIVIALVTRQAFLPRSGSAWRAAWLGPLGTAANACLLWAIQAGMLSVVSVLVSLYPASTVALAALVLRERIHRAQWVGLALAAVAVGLISAP
jgi:drug/metabolite transporter (DMT)-like permease